MILCVWCYISWWWANILITWVITSYMYILNRERKKKNLYIYVFFHDHDFHKCSWMMDNSNRVLTLESNDKNTNERNYHVKEREREEKRYQMDIIICIRSRFKQFLRVRKWIARSVVYFIEGWIVSYIYICIYFFSD